MSSPTALRAQIVGKFFEVAGARLYVRGAPYGPSPWSEKWPVRDDVEIDIQELASKGFNAVRTNVVPPSWFLETAAIRGLGVMVGLPVERWIDRLLDGADPAMIEKVVRGAIARCQPSTAVLCYVLGDGIPASTIRWLGHRPLERFLYRLYLAAKGADPDGAVACAVDPSAHALNLDFLDLLDVLFVNAGAESRASFDRMLRGAQALAADRPLIVGDLGMAGRAKERGRSQFLDWQIRRLLAEGCAGAVLGSRTHPERELGAEEPQTGDGQQRASTEVGLNAVPDVTLFRNAPFSSARQWPRASVVVCSHNGGSTIRECLEGIERLEYPNYETIVVDDGSTDDTATIARAHRVSVISTRRQGLASARNTGLDAATGSIVAFIDHRVRPDPAWLTYLGAGLSFKQRVAVGGSTLRAPGVMNECIANAPGNPTLVLLGGGGDELLQASNMAFRRATLREMGGFDPRFRAGGDEVDIGLRLRDRGYSPATSPGAIVWSRERHSVRGYLRSQIEYGRAEGLLEAKRPHSYNRLGQALSSGGGSGQTSPARLGRRSQLHFGVSGIDWFQLPAGDRLRLLVALPLTPEWYLLVAGLVALTMLGMAWPPLLLAGPLLAVVIAMSILRAIGAARGAFFNAGRHGRLARLLMQMMIVPLHLLQPAARLYGRYRSGLSPWRHRRIARLTFPRASSVRFPTEARRPHDAWLRSLRGVLEESGSLVVDAGPDEGFDLEIQGGTLGSARMLLAVDDRSPTEQIVMVRSWPRWSSWLLLFAAPPAVLSISAAASSVGSVAALMGLLVFDLLLRAIEQVGAAQTGIKAAVTQVVGADADPVSARGRRQLEHELAVHHAEGTALPEQTARRRITSGRGSRHAAPP